MLVVLEMLISRPHPEELSSKGWVAVLHPLRKGGSKFYLQITDRSVVKSQGGWLSTTSMENVHLALSDDTVMLGFEKQNGEPNRSIKVRFRLRFLVSGNQNSSAVSAWFPIKKQSIT